jgi:rod shape-determining protein MreD
MKYIGLALLTYAAIVLQIGARAGLSIDGVSPNFLMLALSLVICCLHDRSAVVAAAVIGFLADCLVAGPLGTTMFAAVIAVYLLRKLFPFRPGTSIRASTAICFLLTWAVRLASTAATALISGTNIDWLPLLTITASIAVYTAVLFCGLRIVYGIVSRLLIRFGKTDSVSRGAARGSFS